MRAPWCIVCGVLLLAGSLLAAPPAPPAAPYAVLLTKENFVETARPGTAWYPANIGQSLFINDRLRTGAVSRATLRLTDLSVLRLNELTTMQLLPPAMRGKPGVDVRAGSIYFFSREKADDLRVTTPIATGALRGTEFILSVGAGGRTSLVMFDGAVELRNELGSVLVRSGEKGLVEPGHAPTKTAVIEARSSIIQWCLYYPAILDPSTLAVPSAAAASVAAYRQGDLLAALARYPRGRTPATAAERVYRAALLLEVGAVEKARAELARVPPATPGVQALHRLIAAVSGAPAPSGGTLVTGSDYLAESYYQQSLGHLEAAFEAARKAVELSPDSGFAHARLAEMHFSFGRTAQAHRSVERALELTPRHAQAQALQGFLLSAENRMGAARRNFEAAIALDPALANAWLGRGLASIRQGDDAAGRQDLQAAATLEPTRSLLRSYLGKAFSQAGASEKANLELKRAQELDPRDPTPWLYSAIEHRQENRYNDAIADLEKSIDLNENRRLYRSSFLLDQDQAVRGTNLAALYRNNGMVEQSIREGTRAVAEDYASAGAHLFLAASYDSLREPTRIMQRYESAFGGELLLANLLSPVGAGTLSQSISQQEYSKLFARDGLGAGTFTEYRSDGQFREIATQYGTVGNLGYAIDYDYFYSRGVRENNRLRHHEASGNFKFQLTPQDTLFARVEVLVQENGDVYQRYDPRDATTLLANDPTGAVDPFGNPLQVLVPNRSGITYHFREVEDPGVLLAGWHHEWGPGQHTLLLAGRLADRENYKLEDAGVDLLERNVRGVSPELEAHLKPGDLLTEDGYPTSAFFDVAGELTRRGAILGFTPTTFDAQTWLGYEAFSAEIQHIATFGPDTLVLGARYQRGDFTSHQRLSNIRQGVDPSDSFLLPSPVVTLTAETDFERYTGYLYNFWHLTPWLTLTGGVAFDSLRYPVGLLGTPTTDHSDAVAKFSPKAAAIVTPWRGATVRGFYAESLSGASFDQSVRLEPVQLSGFLQTSRTYVSESLLGSLLGNNYRQAGFSFEQKVASRTYFGVDCNLREQDGIREVGVFDSLATGSFIRGFVPSYLKENDSYREDSFTASLNQLIGSYWSLGVRYQLTRSRLRQSLPDIAAALRPREGPTNSFPSDESFADLARRADQEQKSTLHELAFYAIFNHPSGFFARGEADWYQQGIDVDETVATGGILNRDAVISSVDRGLPGADFWQFNVLAGYRFHRNLCEVSCGVLNLFDSDYRLTPLNPYWELPRERTFVARLKLAF